MPLTYPAHQALVLPLKARWPQRFDGLALMVGASSPDLLFAAGGDWMFAHTPVGLPILVGLVTSYSILLRRYGLPGICRFLPTVLGADLRIYGAMSARSPSLLTTLLSALVGAVSHQLWDALSHSTHPVAVALGFDEAWATLELGALRRELSVARSIQYIGHALGSVATVGGLLYLARNPPKGLFHPDAAARLVEGPPPRPWPLAAGFASVASGGLLAAPSFGGRTLFILLAALAIAVPLTGFVIESAQSAR
ncbi:MAG: DUF4184 family protein [Myxococcota bacterium]